MDTRALRSRVLFSFGALAILLGSFDPLEGALLILAGTAAVTLAAHLRRSRHRALFRWGLPLTAIGVAALHGLSSVGGLGGRTGRPMVWSIVLVPYAMGWLVTVIGVVLTVIESFRQAATSAS